MNLTLGNYWYLLLLLLLPIVGIFMYRYINWKKKRKNIFAESKFQGEFFPKNRGFSKVLPFLYILAGLFLILSIVDFLSGTEQVKSKQKINNVMFLLDVSNSMNAQDIQTSRLNAAKNLMVQSLTKMKNDRVGLIVFAGDAQSIMPLTADYSAASTYINGIETSVMPTQGTDFLKAMQVAVEKFKNIPKGSRKVVLISDGEDNEGNEPNALKLAKQEGISIVSVGIGTEEGAPVPEYIFGELMGYKMNSSGETVISKRETAALEDLATNTGGSYLDGNNLENAVSEMDVDLQKSASSTESYVSSQTAVHYYQYTLTVSLFFFFLIFLLNPKRDFNI
ncbi:vWA domain-containing protein [Halpernia frigidisoli]|uniref:Ca-activated chloride channel family protein n=1 Tax=Halpernia frigidisoli TaxID=1125876 RepID=A0A1I3FHY6_9FLAO|nr:VWA domain-containing protein [Halpernia frigidisoli]SFI10511.1 Ca-activated chloride channel family protein [Halpernia frigidisoli]